MQLILSTGSIYSYGTERCFALAAAAGFDGVEVMVDYRWDTRQPDYLTRLMERYELPILAVHSPFQTVPGWSTDDVDLITKSVELAETLDASVVVHHLPLVHGHVQLTTWAKHWLIPIPGWDRHRKYRNWLSGTYATVQSNTSIKLCIENMPVSPFMGRALNVYTWNNIDEILRFPYITMDTTHLATWNLDPADTFEHWKHHVQHIHLSNYDGRQHRRPQDGTLDLERFLHRLVQFDYRGAISMELHPDAVRAGETDAEVVEFLSNSLEICRTWLHDASADTRPHMQPMLVTGNLVVS